MAWVIAALPSLAAAAVSASLAAVVLVTRPDRSQNRRLAWVLFILANTVFWNTGLRPLLDDAAWAFASVCLFFVSVSLLPWTYARFLSTLDTPLARPFSSRWLQVPLALLPVPAVAGLLLAPEAFGPDMGVYADIGAFSWGPPPGLPGMFWAITLYLIGGSLFLAGAVLALASIRHARTPVARRQAKAYAAAFLWHDILMVLLTFGAVLGQRPDGSNPFMEGPFAVPLSWIIPPLALGGLAVLLAYGILQTHLFGIDLKIRFALRQSTVAAIFIAVFFAVSELAAAAFSERWGAGMGIAAAAVLVFAIAPLQRLGERIAGATMPRVEDTPEYRSTRARDLYLAALESACDDGVLSAKERSVLATLQDRLGIGAQEALKMEQSLLR